MNNPHNPRSIAYDLEKRLSESIDKMRDNIERSHKLKQALIKARKARKQIEKVPDDVKQWFEDVEDFEDEAEE